MSKKLKISVIITIVCIFILCIVPTPKQNDMDDSYISEDTYNDEDIDNGDTDDEDTYNDEDIDNEDTDNEDTDNEDTDDEDTDNEDTDDEDTDDEDTYNEDTDDSNYINNQPFTTDEEIENKLKEIANEVANQLDPNEYEVTYQYEPTDTTGYIFITLLQTISSDNNSMDTILDITGVKDTSQQLANDTAKQLKEEFKEDSSLEEIRACVVFRDINNNELYSCYDE